MKSCRMMGFRDQDSDCQEFAEVDPTGRYGRYNEILGKGASKTVYRAFDEYEGIEVAWNQVKLHDFLQSPEDLERLYCEIHLLRTLKHKNIMKFYTSWVDTAKRNINFITEMFTSGTLRQYRQKHRRVNIRAVKRWCRQILMGLLYLHSHEPPIIHRDLKCDNIFINGNQGEVKIGDLGLAAILQKSHAAHCVGTPEFMAPEVYEEEYNELVDIYSFGMCVLEMVTFEYPYSECTHPAEIYKKVISGTKPEALNRVRDPVVREFVDKCLTTVSRRLSARELLKDPFLQIDGHCSASWEGDIVEMGYVPKLPSCNPLYSCGSLITNGVSDDFYHETDTENGWDYNVADLGMHGLDLFNGQEDEHLANVDITITGRRGKDGAIFLRLRIADKEDHVRNIYFPFDIETDSALSVAMEMVAELDMTDCDVTRIADIIDGEVSSLVPEWKPGPGIEELPGFPTAELCCTSHVSSSGSLLDFLSSNNHSCGNLQTAYHSLLECGAMHGRFEEITHEAEGSEHSVTEGAPGLSPSQSEALDLCSQESRDSRKSQSGEEGDQTNQLACSGKTLHISHETQAGMRKSSGQICSKSSDRQCSDTSDLGYHGPPNNISEDYENKVSQELHAVELKTQTELLDHGGNQLGTRKALNPAGDMENREGNVEHEATGSPVLFPLLRTSSKIKLRSFHLGRNYSFCIPQDDTNPNPSNESSTETKYGHGWSAQLGLASQREEQRYLANKESNPENTIAAKMFYSGITVSNSIPRTKSLKFLPVGEVDA